MNDNERKQLNIVHTVNTVGVKHGFPHILHYSVWATNWLVSPKAVQSTLNNVSIFVTFSQTVFSVR